MKTKLLPQTRLFMVQCLLTMILAFSFNNAHAQYDGGWDYNPGYGQGVETTQSYVGQYLSQGQQINLMQKLKLKQALRQGKDILAIKVVAQSSSYDSKLVLKLNGQRIDAKPINQHSYETVLSVPSQLNEYDQLTLKVRGQVYVETVSADLKSPYHNPGNGGINQNGVIKAIINSHTQGFHIHKVKQLVKQQNSVRLQGLKVKKVIMKASSARGRAKATLLINGVPTGYTQTIPMGMTRLVFNLDSWSQNIIGQDLRKIQIEIKGKVHTKMVGIKVANHHNRPGNGYGNSVAVNVNQSFYGSQRVSLSSLIGYGPRIDMNAKVESLTITARGRGIINVAGAGRGQGGIQVQGPTTQSLRVGPYTTVRDLMLRIKATGNRVVVEQIRIKLKRY